ncbi:recombinase family protein [Desulfosporosinus metallidurans]|uniref:Site-specific DNA recombinase n=1 Tax=Desulfosporosinus metallidurans TaxID=1888891 RepID=A0A1Q8QRH8_9FIRM|nr:recombinase family protein [Desulfosporosinus metallidurans]OLN29954.1 hypothetical protein DSOL_3294 [Desulfosporosinus metallidurans]
MIVAIYVRVSTDQQAEKGYSLDTQLSECRKKAHELPNALSVEEFIEDGYSGAYLERPALDRMRNVLREKRFGAVIVYDPDRLARNLTHQLLITDEIESSGAQLHFVNFEWQNTPEGKLFYSIQGAVSAYEREKIRERMQRGKRGKALSGKVIANNRPYGYSWDAENSIYTINSKEAEMIRQIFSWVVDDHMGIRAIATRLAKLQYPTRTEKNSWSMGTVHDIIRRETYAGIHWVNKEYKTKIGQNKFKRGTRKPSEWIAVPVPAIIPRETWEAAQRQLQINKRITKQPFDYQYLCRNLIVCPLCGQHMRSVLSGGRRKPYYVCKTGRSISGKFNLVSTEKCPARQIPAKDLDESVWVYISGILKNPEIMSDELSKSNKQEDNNSLQEAILRLNAKEERLHQERDKVTLLFRQDLIDLSMVEKQLTEIKNSLANIKTQRKILEKDLEDSFSPIRPDNLMAKFKDLVLLADTEDPNLRRHVILSVVKKIEAQRIDQRNVGLSLGAEIKTNITFG